MSQALTGKQLEQLLSLSSAAIVDETEVCFPRIDDADEWDKDEGHKEPVLVWGTDGTVVALSEATIGLDESGNITIVETSGTETKLRLLYALDRRAMLNADAT